MLTRWTCLFAVLTAVFSCGAATAAEPYLEFVEGLRQRGYYDTALEYLQSLESRSDLPEDVRTVLPYERAMTLLEGAQAVRDPETRSRQLEQAQALLEQFASAHPNHPRASLANTEQGTILLNRARTAIWSADSPSNAGRREELQAEARELIARARDIFQAAHDQYKAVYDAFDTFIPQEEKEEYAAREKALASFLKAQLDLALCTYELGQTYDRGTEERSRILTQASNEFEEIHTKYRNWTVGLYARMFQGKCFEEQGDLGKALGIYNELLSHGDDKASIRALQDRVRQFRLICLNDDQKKDYQLVKLEAEQWLDEASLQRQRTLAGLGIRWELARALEQLASDSTRSESDRERDLRQALEHAKFINRFPGQFKDVSTFMIRRLNVALGRDGTAPQDFTTAYELGRNLVKQINPLKDKIEAAMDESERDKAQIDYDLHLQETFDMLKLALSLATPETPITELNQARYLLAYIYFLKDQNYEAAILAEFVARHFNKEAPESALDAAHLAMASYVKAYNAVPPGESRDVELELMREICTLIADRWPGSDRANDARMTLGGIYKQDDKPVEAAEWYGQVPETATAYAEAQLEAGQAYWLAVINASAREPEARPAADELQTWKQQARKFLQTGIEKTAEQLPADGTASDAFIAGKVSLAQILIDSAEYEEAISLLTSEPHAPVKAIAVAQEDQRPAKGVKSREFASLVYQLLLRSYVGTQQIDEALRAMDELEYIGGSDSTAIYVQLGQELEKELKRLQAANEIERLRDVRGSFEAFLNELYQRQRGQTYNSLVWIGETYFGLGQGSADDPAKSREYFDKAGATYEKILQEAEEQPPGWAPVEKLPAVRLRLVTCKRNQGDFQGALQLITGILEERPKALDAQFEGAKLLQAWGDSGQAGSGRRYLEAIQGKEPIWGWAELSSKLQRLVDAGLASPEQQQRYYDARYASIECRLLAGQADAARQELEVFATVSGDVPADDWERFNSLYASVRETLALPPRKLQRPKSVPPAAVADNAATGQTQDSDTDPTTQDEAEQKVSVPEPEGPSTLAVILVVLVALGGTGAMVYFMARPKKRRPSYATSAPDRFPAPAGPPQAAATATRGSATRKAAAKGTASAAPRTAQKRSRSAASGQSGAAQQDTQPQRGEKRSQPKLTEAQKAKLRQKRSEE